jgi:hypothetical protein
VFRVSNWVCKAVIVAGLVGIPAAAIYRMAALTGAPWHPAADPGRLLKGRTDIYFGPTVEETLEDAGFDPASQMDLDQR